MKNYIEKIEAYFNEELSGEEESLMFSEIAEDYEAREYFKKVNLLKTALRASAEKTPYELDEKILKEVLEKKHVVGIPFQFNFQTVFTYVLSVAFLVLSLLFYSMLKDYRSELKEAKSVIQYQSKTLNVLLNSLPPVDVTGKLPNKIIINSKL